MRSLLAAGLLDFHEGVLLLAYALLGFRDVRLCVLLVLPRALLVALLVLFAVNGGIVLVLPAAGFFVRPVTLVALLAGEPRGGVGLLAEFVRLVLVLGLRSLLPEGLLLVLRLLALGIRGLAPLLGILPLGIGLLLVGPCLLHALVRLLGVRLSLVATLLLLALPLLVLLLLAAVVQRLRELRRGLVCFALGDVLPGGDLLLRIHRLLGGLGGLREPSELGLDLEPVERVDGLRHLVDDLRAGFEHDVRGELAELLLPVLVVEVLLLLADQLLDLLLDLGLLLHRLALGLLRLVQQLLELVLHRPGVLLGEVVVVLEKLLLHHLHVVQDGLHLLEFLEKLVPVGLLEAVGEVLEAIRRKVLCRIRGRHLLLLEDEILHRSAEDDDGEERDVRGDGEESPEGPLAAASPLAAADVVGLQADVDAVAVVAHGRQITLCRSRCGCRPP